MKSVVNVGIIGAGNIGLGTLQLLKEQRKRIEARVGAKIRILWVCSRRKKKSPYIPKSAQQTRQWRRVVKDPNVDLVIELIGGTNPAKAIVTSAIKNGKHVITANKAILAHYWNEITGLARKHKKLVYFEAAVGGGVPVVQALNEGLAGNQIQKIVGILNGTTNYILTRMQEEGLSFSEALSAAQKAGFAEADPSFDVRGIDAAQKISILGSLALGRWTPPHRVHCEGITKLKTEDIRYINKRFRSTIKLLGIAERTKAGWIFRVHPTLIRRSHPFSTVRNEYNAVSIHGNAVEDVMLYGKGAGRLPTSSAVISDLIFLTRHIANETAGQLPFVQMRKKGHAKFVSLSYVRCKYYIRINTLDHPGVLSRITGILGKHNVSIASVHQDESAGNTERKGVPIILLTHKNLESDVRAAVKSIDRLRTTKAKSIVLRME